MKAMILTKAGPIASQPLRMAEIPIPEPGENEILIKVSVCGVCHTDLDIVEGRLEASVQAQRAADRRTEAGRFAHTEEPSASKSRPLPPKAADRRTEAGSFGHSIVPGHQVVGTVIKRGTTTEMVQRFRSSDVQRAQEDAFRGGFRIGERVGVTWLYSSCGKCRFCAGGRENLCDNARWTGLDADGGYAEYMVVDGRFAVSIPERFSDVQAAPLLCAGVIGYRALRLCNMQPGETLALYGFGASAHFVVQVAKYKWPDAKVFVFTRGKGHRALAMRLGADWAGEAGEVPPGTFQKAIEFTPVGSAVKEALGAVEKGGRVVVNAIRKESAVPEMDYARYLWNEKELVSTANVTRADAQEFLDVASRIPIQAEVEEFRLEEANEALLKVKEGKLKAAGVLRIG
jgi:alcohol dehydrogenase, propanol-preferring